MMMATTDWDDFRQRAAAAQLRWERAFAPTASETNRILARRAGELAASLGDGAASEPIEVVAFKLGQQSCAIEISFVREVRSLHGLTAIPCTPRFVLGVISLRGELCPVVDARTLFGMPASGLTNVTRAVVLRDMRLEFAIAVDTVFGVQTIELAGVAPVPVARRDVQSRFLRGITADGRLLIDAAAVLADPAIIIDEQVEGWR